ncbi:MAG TPA: hypothetical protein VGG72_35535 [Bryobacteraceae bacterium]
MIFFVGICSKNCWRLPTGASWNWRAAATPGVNLFDLDDENLLCSTVRGEFNITGQQNKTLRRHLPELNRVRW